MLGHEAAHPLGGFFLHLRGDMGVGVQREARAVVPQDTGDCFGIHSLLDRQCGKRVPIRYNKDKSDKPLQCNGLNGLSLFFFPLKTAPKMGLGERVKNRDVILRTNSHCHNLEARICPLGITMHSQFPIGHNIRLSILRFFVAEVVFTLCESMIA